jgi:hypothetical protein
MSDDKLRAAAERGRQVREFMEGDGGLYQIMDAVERDYTKTLFGSDIVDNVLREKIYHRVAALRDVRRVINEIVVGGKEAAAIINANQLKQKRKA